MKKFFLIPLMTLMCSVAAWGDEVVTVGDFESLKDAINGASNGDVIKLTADINFGTVAYGDNLNVKKSITIDGQGHTLKGAGQRQEGNSNYATIWLNLNGSSVINVTVKDLTIINERTTGAYNNKGIETRGNIGTLTLNNVSITANSVPLQIGGYQASNAKINMDSCKLKALTYYCIMSYNPYTLKAKNCEFRGWNALYFKGVDSSAGSRGADASLTDCTLNCPNIYDTPTNAFAMFVCEDDGISITLDNCGMHAEQLGNQTQTILMLSNFASKTRRSTPVSLSILGDNSYINGRLVSYSGWASGWYNNAPSDAAIPDPCPLSITISGGTYAFNPAEQGWLKNQTYETEEELYDESNIGLVTIPDGYEVSEIETQQGDQTTKLYRVRKEVETAYKAEIENPEGNTVSYTINADVEAEGEGQNANTDFKISADETVNVPSNAVVANYVEVSNDATLTVPEGATLAVTNGLDVTDGAQVVVEAGSTVMVGEGGIVAESTESIVIEADENGAASLLLDPKVIVNTTPNLTVKMTAKQIGKTALGEFWHRFAMPVAHIDTWEKQGDIPGTTYPTYLYYWDYANDKWANVGGAGVSAMVPFMGYTLRLQNEAISGAQDALHDVTYIFRGNLAGNMNSTLNFTREGFNFFGNSYTGYISLKQLKNQLFGDAKIDATVYVWDTESQGYEDVAMGYVRDDDEIAPMHTFVMKLNEVGSHSTEINYASAIWGNPRYSTGTGTSAPARHEDNDGVSSMNVVITAANGQKDIVHFYEDAARSNEYENGYDAVKFMNEKTINVYSTFDGEDLGTVASDNLVGKTISLNTNDEIAYTLSFNKVNGVEYALEDVVTGKTIAIEEGTTYEFAAQPNSKIADRFRIVNIHKVPTSVETTEVKSGLKGIYTILGQYVGEDFRALPAGVYVVDGVKIVK